jgi:chemotaxis protein MotB
MKNFLLLVAFPVVLFSCVSSKKFKASKADYNQLQVKYTLLQTDFDNCKGARASLESDNANLNKLLADRDKQIAFLKENNTTVLTQLQNLSVVTSAQAESIKKSLENIGAKDIYISRTCSHHLPAKIHSTWVW